MTDPERTVPEGLVEAPFSIENAVARVGGALWLYLSLVLRRNRLGLVCRTLSSLARDLGVTEEEITRWLARLVDTGLVEVEHPAPYLVLKLRFWSGSASESPESSSALTRARSRVKRLLPEQQPEAAPAAGEVGGPGEGADSVAEALRVLGSGADETEVRRLLSRYPAERIRRALARVERTPRDQIRRSRLALFRYLLVILTHDSHDRHPSN